MSFHVIDADNKVGALFMYNIIPQEKKKNLEGSLGVNQEVYVYTKIKVLSFNTQTIFDGLCGLRSETPTHI